MRTISSPPRGGPWVMLTGLNIKKNIKKQFEICLYKNQTPINHISKTIDPIDWGP